MEKKYALGIDFGSLSARALLLDLSDGSEAASSVQEYAHAVMDERLCDQSLPPDYALQHPQDYVDALSGTIGEVLRQSAVHPTQIIGVAIDFTASTVLPIDARGTPLCFDPRFRSNPHAYVKMWKHHAAQRQAIKLQQTAFARKEAFLEDYSGQISSEWLFPKLWQILDEAPEIYDAMDQFIEAGDWVTSLLTGNDVRSAGMAGYKALWSQERGYPSADFLSALDPRLAHAEEKLSSHILPVGTCAGTITEKAAAWTGLVAGTPVAVAMIDAHAALPAVGVTKPGKLMMMLGTSNCLLTLGAEKKNYRGICGVVRDGMIAGYYGYEAGQACAGDHFDWFVKNAMPYDAVQKAEARGMSRHSYLRSLAEKKKPGETGLLALDWWNGVRSDLMDENLSGMLLGMTLGTRAEDIYRALLEAVAYGARIITENYEKAGVRFDEIVACGGIAVKDPLLMQIFSDVLGKAIHVSAAKQAGAFGSAMTAATVGGYYRTLDEAAHQLVKPPVKTYHPIPENCERYETLFSLYRELHDRYGAPGSLMKRLREGKGQR